MRWLIYRSFHGKYTHIGRLHYLDVVSARQKASGKQKYVKLCKQYMAGEKGSPS